MTAIMLTLTALLALAIGAQLGRWSGTARRRRRRALPSIQPAPTWTVTTPLARRVPEAQWTNEKRTDWLH